MSFSNKEEDVLERVELKGSDLDSCLTEILNAKTGMSKYEKSMHFQLKKATVYLAVICTFNLVLPIYTKSRGFNSILQYVVLLCFFYGYLGQLGYKRNQPVPLLQISGVRALQLAWHIFFSHNKICWTPFLIMLCFDVFYYAELYVFKSRYKFEAEVYTR